MKRKPSASLTILAVLTFFLIGCSGENDCPKDTKCVEWGSKDVKEIAIFIKDANGNKGVAGIIQDQMKIDTFVIAIQKAEPIPGELKVSPPDYEVEIVLKDNKKAAPSPIQLWLPSGTEGMIVYSNKSSHGYKLTTEQNKEISAIIESNRIHPAK
jgi:hypothetical protein